jgi:hypothetical protein
MIDRIDHGDAANTHLYLSYWASTATQAELTNGPRRVPDHTPVSRAKALAAFRRRCAHALTCPAMITVLLVKQPGMIEAMRASSLAKVSPHVN